MTPALRKVYNIWKKALSLPYYRLFECRRKDILTRRLLPSSSISPSLPPFLPHVSPFTCRTKDIVEYRKRRLTLLSPFFPSPYPCLCPSHPYSLLPSLLFSLERTSISRPLRSPSCPPHSLLTPR